MQGTNAHAILNHVASHEALARPEDTRPLLWSRSRHWVLPAVDSFISKAIPQHSAGQPILFEACLGQPAGPSLKDLAVSGRPTLTLGLWTHLTSAAVTATKLDSPGPRGLNPASSGSGKVIIQHPSTILLGVTGASMTLPRHKEAAALRGLHITVSVDLARGTVSVQHQQQPTSRSSPSPSRLASSGIGSITATAGCRVAADHTAASSATWAAVALHSPGAICEQDRHCRPTALAEHGMPGSSSAHACEPASPPHLPAAMAAWEASVQTCNLAGKEGLDGNLGTPRLPTSAAAWLDQLPPGGSFPGRVLAVSGPLAAPGSQTSQRLSGDADISWEIQSGSFMGPPGARACGLVMNAISPRSAVTTEPKLMYSTVWMAQQPQGSDGFQCTDMQGMPCIHQLRCNGTSRM